MKKCKANGCNNDVFSHLYCRAHQWIRTDDKYKKYKELKKSGKIARKSKKRIKEEERYTAICKEIEIELRSQDKDGNIYCFFSGEEIIGAISWHHLRGRGVNLKDRRYLVPTINDNHLDYHFMSYDKFKKKVWYEDWLTRLKEKDEESYKKELRRADKATPLNPMLNFKEDYE